MDDPITIRTLLRNGAIERADLRHREKFVSIGSGWDVGLDFYFTLDGGFSRPPSGIWKKEEVIGDLPDTGPDYWVVQKKPIEIRASWDDYCQTWDFYAKIPKSVIGIL